MWIMEHFSEGGWGMWPILILLAITAYIAIDRFMYLGKSKVDVDKLMSLLKSQIVSGNIQGAVNTCPGQPGAGDEDHRGRPAQGGRHRARRAAGHGRRGAP